MKNNKNFLFAILSMLAISSLVACGGGNKPTPSSSQPEEEEEERPLEIGDTVKEWIDSSKYEGLPMDVPEGITGTREIVDDFGNGDNVSLHYSIKAGSDGTGYIDSGVVEEPLFTEDDGKNGDIISLFVYIPANSNLAELKLEIYSSPGQGWNSNQEVVEGTKVEVNSDKQEKWIRLEGSFDCLYTFGSVRLNYTPVDAAQEVEFYVDNVNITLGEETVETEYTSVEGESLYQAFEDYFKVGACMSASMLRNTTLRKIAKEQFNSLTAENEGKPEQILDQEACQALSDKSQVVITMKPFEKLYNFCEANHIGVRHHTFVWYSQTPSWFFTQDYSGSGQQASRELMLQRMENFIKVTLESINDRWPGLVYAIDVANEALQQTNIRSNNNKWYDTVGDRGDGDNFVYYAFKYAKMYKAEDQELYYNDYEYDYNTSYCDYALNTLLKKAIAEDLIDGVGIQGHIDWQNIRHDIENAKHIKAKGLKCQITELDITTNNNEEGYENQRKAYKDMVKQILLLNERGETDVNAFVVWGITDNLSWKSNQNPLLFDANYKKKPAYYGCLEALRDYLEGNYDMELSN